MTLKLKELLKQKKMAANMLAEKLNVSPVTVSYWSTGGSFPYLNLDGEVYTPSNIEALLRVLRLYDERGLDMAYRAIKSE